MFGIVCNFEKRGASGAALVNTSSRSCAARPGNRPGRSTTSTRPFAPRSTRPDPAGSARRRSRARSSTTAWAAPYADTCAPGPSVRATPSVSCVLHVPEAQGSLPPRGATRGTHAVRVPAPYVPRVPRTVAPQADWVAPRSCLCGYLNHSAPALGIYVVQKLSWCILSLSPPNAYFVLHPCRHRPSPLLFLRKEAFRFHGAVRHHSNLS